MTSQAPLTAPPSSTRPGKRTPADMSPARAGLPDPRPVTDYDAVYKVVAGNSRITITLLQPCVIRDPKWTFIDSATGDVVEATSVKPDGNDTIVFDFTGIIADTVCFVDVPCQDMQVQNFQGGFVRPGGKWFARG